MDMYLDFLTTQKDGLGARIFYKMGIVPLIDPVLSLSYKQRIYALLF